MNLLGKGKAIIVFSCCMLMQPCNYSLAQVTPSTPDKATNKTMENYDHSILESVRTALGIHGKKLTIRVDNGIVYLSGQLNSHAEYESVVMLVESTLGVVDLNVENLSVQGNQTLLSDTLLRARIKGLLLQTGRLGKDVPSWPLHIEVNNGQVSLTGKVASFQDKQFIIDTVKSVDDVKTVKDNIEITIGLPAH